MLLSCETKREVKPQTSCFQKIKKPIGQIRCILVQAYLKFISI